jgi:hypothetical protein
LFTSFSACAFTTSAAQGCRIGAVWSPTRRPPTLTMGAFAALRGLPKISTTALWRALFNTGPGPDAGGEKPGPSVFDHSREKSGTDAALWVAVLARSQVTRRISCLATAPGTPIAEAGDARAETDGNANGGPAGGIVRADGITNGQQRTIQSLSNAQKISVKFNPELPAGRAEVP